MKSLNVLQREKKEVISVCHNTAEEMRATVKALSEEGWSDNTRISLSGTRIFQTFLSDDELDYVKEQFPALTIHESTRTFSQQGKYILMTTHERTIED